MKIPHKNFFNFNNKSKRKNLTLFSEGESLNLITKSYIKLPILNKKGCIIPMDTAVRLSSNLTNSFQLIVILSVETPIKNNCILLLDSKGLIRESTLTASRYFKKEVRLSLYNQEFDRIMKVRRIS